MENENESISPSPFLHVIRVFTSATQPVWAERLDYLPIARLPCFLVWFHGLGCDKINRVILTCSCTLPLASAAPGSKLMEIFNKYICVGV
jgi:hypothetical protein